jgi:hypothetical protein
MHKFRRHLNYANVIATLALVFAMSGGALAAKHYLINSTKQINPKVLKKLKGNTGKTGAAGPQGAPGAAGKEGSQGKEGPAGHDGQAIAYALMDKSGTLQDVHNFSTHYTQPSTGVYCLTATGGVNQTKNPVALVTVEWIGSSGNELFAYTSQSFECSPGQYAVRTYDPIKTASNNVEFWIAVMA